MRSARGSSPRVIRRLRPAVVVVTAPECYAWVRPSLGHATLAYDCMDDALAFAQDAGVRARKAALERELLARADAVVASTATLAARCVERGAVRARVTVVRNGWDPAAFPVEPSRALPTAGALTLGYFGTIGDWLDIAALETIVARCPEALIRLIGPNATGYASAAPRIRVEAPLPHGALAAAVADCDAMLLPFRVDDLTRGVDPVKLYEYIALGRPIACIGYPELERFAAYATLCRDGDELASRIASRDLTAAADLATRTRFLDGNTWEARAREFEGALCGVRPRQCRRPAEPPGRVPRRPPPSVADRGRLGSSARLVDHWRCSCGFHSPHFASKYAWLVSHRRWYSPDAISFLNAAWPKW